MVDIVPQFDIVVLVDIVLVVNYSSDIVLDFVQVVLNEAHVVHEDHVTY